MTTISSIYDCYYGIIDPQHLKENNFMAQIDNAAIVRKGRSFSHKKKQVLRIDMTPMVDLGFLLITFFVFTTTISRPTATDLFMPKDDINPQPLPKSLALTILLDDNNKIYFYNGDFNDALKKDEIFESGYSIFDGIGKAIRQKQKDLELSGKFDDPDKTHFRIKL